MLQLLLEEQISYVVADGLTAHRPDILITSVHRWRNGALKGQSDALLLRAAAEDALTLVTYDLRTIRPLINEWRALGISHGGVLLVDERTIYPDDFGGLIRAIEALWDSEHDAVWTDRMSFLRPRRP